MSPAVALIVKCDYQQSVNAKKLYYWTDLWTDAQTDTGILLSSSARNRQHKNTADAVKFLDAGESRLHYHYYKVVQKGFLYHRKELTISFYKILFVFPFGCIT